VVLVAFVLLAGLLGAPALAQEQVGSVASMQGTVQVMRAGAIVPLSVGAAIFNTDEIRTGRPGRVRVVFRDESVLVLADESKVAVNQQVVDENAGVFDSLYNLLEGKVRTLVSEYYKDPQARFEVHTKTAVSGVRGTEFIVVYDPVTALTEVVVVRGTVAVWSPLDPKGSLVLVTDQQVTRIGEGQAPTQPETLDDATFDNYLDGSQVPGDGLPESLVESQPVLSGGDVPPPDRAEPVTAGAPPQGGPGQVGVGQAAETFPANSSPAIGDVLQQPVGQVETSGSVRVGF